MRYAQNLIVDIEYDTYKEQITINEPMVTTGDKIIGKKGTVRNRVSVRNWVFSDKNQASLVRQNKAENFVSL